MDGRLVFLPAVVGRILVRWKCKKVSASPFPPLHTAFRSDAHWRSGRRHALFLSRCSSPMPGSGIRVAPPSRGSSLTPFSFCPPIRPHLPVTSPVPAVPFRGGKRWCGAKKSVSVQGVAVQAVPFRNSEAFRLHQNFFRKKGVKKFAGKEKGYTFAAANEVKRSNPSGLEKRRGGH